MEENYEYCAFSQKNKKLWQQKHSNQRPPIFSLFCEDVIVLESIDVYFSKESFNFDLMSQTCSSIYFVLNPNFKAIVPSFLLIKKSQHGVLIKVSFSSGIIVTLKTIWIQGYLFCKGVRVFKSELYWILNVIF